MRPRGYNRPDRNYSLQHDENVMTTPSRKRYATTEESDDDMPLAQKRKVDSKSILAEDPWVDPQGFALSDVAENCKIPAQAVPLLVWKANRTLNWRPHVHGNLKVGFNVQAAISYIVGEEVEVPCDHCSNGHGPFTRCIR